MQAAEIVAGRLINADPLAVSGKPVVFIYQEDPIDTTAVTQIKRQLGMLEARFAQKLRPLHSPNAQDFVKSMNYYFKTLHLLKEIAVSNRRFPVNVGGTIGKQSRTLQSHGLYVWEVKTDGERAIMVCRGSYAFPNDFWKLLEFKTALATQRAYMIGTFGANTKNTGLLMVQPIDANDFAARKDPVHWMSAAVDKAQSSRPKVKFSRFTYEPESSILADFNRFVRQTVKGRSKFKLKPQVMLPEDGKQAFYKSMQISFERRPTIRAFQLQGSTYYMTLHRGYLPAGPLSEHFLAIWRWEQQGKEGIMRAVALFPMTRNSFEIIVNRGSLEAHSIEFASRRRARQ